MHRKKCPGQRSPFKILLRRLTIRRERADMKPTPNRFRNFAHTAISVGAFAGYFSQVTAQAGIYSLGGNCPTQGAWTQMALQQSQNIAQAIQQLKDNPKCKGIENVLLNLQSAQRDLQTLASGSEVQRESQLEAFPGEFQSLKHAITEGGRHNAGAESMLLNRTLKAASVSADLNDNSTPAFGTKFSLSNLVGSKQALTVLFNKIKAPTEKGLDMISGVMQKLPEYDECLIGHPRQGLAILSGAVKTAAAYSAAGEGVGDKLGNTIIHFASMARDRKFTQALRQVDETEFWFSVSCLLESAAKNYCEAENAQEILKYTKDQYIATAKKNRPDMINLDNPLEGYYLMVRDLPNIQQWLQKVQFGAKPRLKSDALQKTRIWQQVTDLTNKTNEVEGYFSEQMMLLNELPDLSSKQNQLFATLESLVTSLSGAGGDIQTSDSAMFFSNTVNSAYLPFFLIGRDSIPPECRANSDGKFPMPWSDYLKSSNNGNYVAEFSDPAKLASVMESKMRWVLEEAGKKASKYFRERLIVDSADLVNQTMSNQYLTVQKSLQNVVNYLTRFEKRLLNSKNPDDIDMLPSVRETRVKVLRVLRSYADLRALATQMASSPSKVSDTDISPRVRDASRKVIDTAFDEFNIWMQKDSFLTGRLSTMIQKDFQMKIKQGLNMSAYQQDIMTITQQHLLDKLISVHGVNPTNSQDDLHQAQVINRRNLNVLQEVFGDTLYRMVVEMKAVADGKGEAGVRRALDEKFKAERKTARLAWRYMPTVFPYPGTNLLGWLTAGFAVRERHRDLWYQSGNLNKVSGNDTRFGSFAAVQAKFCAQSLAFQNRDFYRDICKGTTMKSYYSDIAKTSLDLVYDQYLPAGMSLKIRNDPEKTSEAICAVSRYNTRNLVQWMKEQDRELIEDDSIQY